jgi:hypothetical protein
MPLFHHQPPPPPPDLGALRQEIEQQLAILIETRRGAGRWQGASQGVSVRVPGTKSMRYRVGQSRGTFVPSDESPTQIDIGTFALTNQRATFMGAKQTREWLWAKLIGVAHQHDAPWTALAVSNRQKTSGVGYDDEHAGLIRFWIDLAVAKASGSTEGLIRELEGELAAAGGATPPPAIAASAPATEARWAADPFGRFELRWWDGQQWTDHVSTGGLPSTDVVTGQRWLLPSAVSATICLSRPGSAIASINRTLLLFMQASR